MWDPSPGEFLYFSAAQAYRRALLEPIYLFAAHPFQVFALDTLAVKKAFSLKAAGKALQDMEGSEKAPSCGEAAFPFCRGIKPAPEKEELQGDCRSSHAAPGDAEDLPGVGKVPSVLKPLEEAAHMGFVAGTAPITAGTRLLLLPRVGPAEAHCPFRRQAADEVERD